MLVTLAKPNSAGYSLIWMGAVKERVLEFINTIRSSKALSLAVILVLAAAIPLTVFLAQKQQDIRQRAVTITEPKPNDQSKEDKPLRTRGYIVELKNPSLVEQQKKLEKAGKKGASLQSETTSYQTTLDDEHQNAKKDLLSILGKGSVSIQSTDQTLKVLNEYTKVLNGFALDITQDQADKIKQSSFVKNVSPNIAAYANLQDSVPLIKADQVWQTTDSNGDPVKGKGKTIAIIDTGIDYRHPDLGGTQVSERPFTRIALQNNILSFTDQSFSFNNNRIAYALGDKIKIYDLSSQTTQSIDASESAKPFRLLLRDNILAYFASDEQYNTSLYAYDLNTNAHKKIADNMQIVRTIAVTDGKVIYVRPSYSVDETGHFHIGEEIGLFFYDVASGIETAIEPFTPSIDSKFIDDPRASGNTVVYDVFSDYGPNNLCGTKAVLYDLTSGTKRAISPPYLGAILDFKGNKLLYEGCYTYNTNWNNYYLYDTATNQSQHISYTGTTALGDTSSSTKNIRLTSSYNNKGSIGNNVIFFSPDGGGNQIVVYDLATQRYVLINLYLNSTAIEAEDKTVCFSAEDKYIYCHTYDPNISYALPTNFFNSKVIGGYDFVHNDNDPFDDHGHGTHVAAIAAGLANSTASTLGGGGPTPTPIAPYLGGVAPEAKLVAYKVLNSNGSGWWSNIIAAIEKAVETRFDSDPNNNIDVINMSLGADCVGWYGSYQSYCGPDDPQSRAVDNAVDAGIVVTVAAGNSGYGPGESIGTPGTARKAITVGAVNKSKQMADFSSKGPVTYNGEVIQKPDVVAPGVDICAAERGSWYSYKRCRDDNHIAISGTSMASPHVAGVAALLAQKHPDWVASQIKSAIVNTAENLGVDQTMQGKGLVDALSALSNNPPTPTPTPAPPVITSIRPAWIKEEYKAQPWINQGEKVAVKGSGFSPVASQNQIYVRGAFNGTAESASSDGTSLTFTLSTELDFEIGNYYDLSVKNQNGQSNSLRIRIISPTVLFPILPPTASRSELTITLKGINFGYKQGTVFIADAASLGTIPLGAKTLGGGGGGFYLGEIKSWKNNEIRMVLPKELRYSGPPKDYLVWVNGTWGGRAIYQSNRVKLRVK